MVGARSMQETMPREHGEAEAKRRSTRRGKTHFDAHLCHLDPDAVGLMLSAAIVPGVSVGELRSAPRVVA